MIYGAPSLPLQTRVGSEHGTALRLRPTVIAAVAVFAAAGTFRMMAAGAESVRAAPPPVITPAPPPPPPQPTAASAPAPKKLPTGKGMWLHRLEWAAGNDPVALAAQAKSHGLTHLYLRLGSSKSGFYGQADMDRLLPAAHAAGLAVIGWDFPYLFQPFLDAERAAAQINYVTPDGHTLDAFSADIETPAEGVATSPATVAAYSARLRELTGNTMPLIATVPRPSSNSGFPYAEAMPHFDAVAPMVYWMAKDPVAEVTAAIDGLAHFGKPVLPVGQAYDGAIDGSHPGPPPKEALVRFMEAAKEKGAPGVSFWVWHTATPDHWAAIAETAMP